MKAQSAAIAYAKALFELASVEDCVAQVEEELETVTKTVAGHLKLKEVLGDANFPAEKKRDIVRQLFSEKVSPLVLGTLTMLVDTGRDGELAEVTTAYADIAEAGTGAITAKVTTAVPLTEALRKELMARLSAVAGKDIALREKVDPTVLGGVVVEMGGTIRDGSVRARLAEMKIRLVQPAQAAGTKEGEA